MYIHARTIETQLCSSRHDLIFIGLSFTILARLAVVVKPHFDRNERRKGPKKCACVRVHHILVEFDWKLLIVSYNEKFAKAKKLIDEAIEVCRIGHALLTLQIYLNEPRMRFSQRQKESDS